MKNYRLKIQYDGTNYAGWQIQENADTIQKKVTDAIEVVLKEKVNLIGSGRTDAGVHALGQVANFRTEKKISIFRFQHSLNAILPDDISISEMSETNEEFHSRFDAKKRSYIYLLTLIKSPFYKKYSWHYHNEIDINYLLNLSAVLKGKIDFTSFSKKNSEIKNKTCEVYHIHWRRSGSYVIFYVEANRFLHGMVRTIVGTLLKAEKEKRSVDYIKEILKLKDREAACEAAPAKGLFLYKVKY